MNVKCGKCGAMNNVPNSDQQYRCYSCGAYLPQPSGDTSAAVGLIGGAALGAAIGGPPGALIGAVIGLVLGSTAKGVG
jgi:ribosomal protein S27E